MQGTHGQVDTRSRLKRAPLPAQLPPSGAAAESTNALGCAGTMPARLTWSCLAAGQRQQERERQKRRGRGGRHGLRRKLQQESSSARRFPALKLRKAVTFCRKRVETWRGSGRAAGTRTAGFLCPEDTQFSPQDAEIGLAEEGCGTSETPRQNRPEARRSAALTGWPIKAFHANPASPRGCCLLLARTPVNCSKRAASDAPEFTQPSVGERSTLHATRWAA